MDHLDVAPVLPAGIELIEATLLQNIAGSGPGLENHTVCLISNE